MKNDHFSFHDGILGVSIYQLTRKISKKDRHEMRHETNPPFMTVTREADYRILVSRAGDRGKASFWPVGLREQLPPIGIPLRGSDPDVTLDLAAVLNAAYDNASYGMSIDYRRKPNPPLSAEDRIWANRLLRERGLADVETASFSFPCTADLVWVRDLLRESLTDKKPPAGKSSKPRRKKTPARRA
jgi:hypothetical protein